MKSAIPSDPDETRAGRASALPHALLPYSDCQTWNDPKAAQLLQAGALLRDHPNVRALMVCEICGQRWLYDFLDSEDWGGDGDGRVIYAPVPQALAEAACAELTVREVDRLRPRLVVHDDTTNRIDRVV